MLAIQVDIFVQAIDRPFTKSNSRIPVIEYCLAC